MHALSGALSGINTAGKISACRIISHHASLIIAVFILTKAVVEFRCPFAVETVFGIQLRQIRFAIGDIKRLIKTGFAIHIHRVFGVEIENGAAIERGFIVAM
ncbi:hypothetical protein SDC9_160534 [bioreactor metagenome]|uniref:Uncharacterized protein n=1 Tax=bioreactor metagenome TaxID=1076179 RepID=A0A645FLC7_9ZZZZ